MDTDKIILPDFLIADLYKETLVDIDRFANTQQSLPANLPTPAYEKKNKVVVKIKYNGENRKNITIVVNSSRAESLPREEMAFLSNILKACQLNTTDVAIVNVANQPVTFTEIKEQLNAFHILLFDTEPSVVGLPFKIPPFQVQNYDNSKIMLAPALAQLNQNTTEGKLLKTKFWNSLKLLFNIT